MPTLRERLMDFIKSVTDLFAPASFGIVDNQGEMRFVSADTFTVSKSGRLLFWRRGVLCAAFAEDRWQRVLKGITLDDVKAVEE
jgi:hypothetical protein